MVCRDNFAKPHTLSLAYKASTFFDHGDPYMNIFKYKKIIYEFDTITHAYKTLNTSDKKNQGVYLIDFKWTVNCFKPHELL